MKNNLFIIVMLCSFLASHEVSVSYSNISENSVDTITCKQKIMLMK